ncbi:MAG TPA: TolC family protein, partial [Gemmataceae bacterium]
SPIRPIEEQLARFQRVIDDFREARLQADELIRVDIDAEKDRFRLREAVERLVAESGITRGTQFRENFPRRWGKYRRLGDAELAKLLKAYLDERDKLRKERSDILARREPVPEELDRRLEELGSEISIAELELALRGAERRPWVDLLKRGELGPYRAAGIAAGSPVWVELLIKELVAADRLRQALFRNVRVALVSVLTEPRAERLQQVRESWPELPPVIVAGADLLELDLDRAYDVSAQVALSNRLDLMNSRAQLVDAWRQIAVQANSLLGVLDVRYNLESRTPQGLNRPLDFSGSRTRHQLTFNGELPLVRRAERNNYRASLIAYQRQRRVLQATEDFILRDIRGELRQLRVLAETYRIQQRAVEVAYLSLETAFEEFDAPRTEQRFDVAGETQQLLNAQARLPQSQREIYAVWIDYLTARMQLYRDLELMPLDARGVWIDDLSRQDEAPADGDGPGDDGEPQRLPEPRPLDGPAPAGAQR